ARPWARRRCGSRLCHRSKELKQHIGEAGAQLSVECFRVRVLGGGPGLWWITEGRQTQVLRWLPAVAWVDMSMQVVVGVAKKSVVEANDWSTDGRDGVAQERHIGEKLGALAKREGIELSYPWLRKQHAVAGQKLGISHNRIAAAHARQYEGMLAALCRANAILLPTTHRRRTSSSGWVLCPLCLEGTACHLVTCEPEAENGLAIADLTGAHTV